ncbi:hypothetical protein VD0002_g7461 [Verticillium dahliae]|uniref:CHY zinc finger domain-containing protein n=2 Tax=Verticillium dahliae TaxID=27337 RepID=G2X5K6_VERDV|nr:CHY zinc finger domain-containing protein [Verticillium dahliae VdLs.17]KAH6700998.1 CHY zinc finger domain-containing protein [Verticillium dahliae]EGY14347.1 CHY zinc finger domain-containing protein [Verticillium dahliae VdLs.17]PNH33768.1 hypothetical protein BJF96_g2755 [Verticillium dahliae]PNH42041.1 hypothetical protein VD0004_g5193 [Verticillium dahliae]PNH52436.1 hypothetical protein VD0003_g4883 [Verticillium dahliae]
MMSLEKQGGITHLQAVTEPAAQRVVSKPTPEAQKKDPRGYQVEQIRRRFSPRETTLSDGTTSLIFRMKPSDPDFPFDLDFLQCDLHVPEDYPETAPVLHVKNRNIPRGFGINVERGWERIVREKRGAATLLAFAHSLDKNLEVFLSEQKVETVKLTIFKDDRHETPSTSSSQSSAVALEAAALTQAPSAPQPTKRHVPDEPAYTQEQMAEAKARRAQEARQIETRMGRLSLYRRSADGIVYTLPIEPKRRSELPASLQAVKTLHMIVPLLYPLQPLRIQLNEVDSFDAEPVEELFIQKAAEQKQMNLTSHLNYLAQNLHALAKQAQVTKQKQEAEAKAKESSAPATTVSHTSQEKQPEGSLGDRSHVKVIPRPPEWATAADDSDSSDYSYDSDSGSDAGGAALEHDDPVAGSSATAVAADTPERGTALTFPSIELHNIELFQVSLLSITAKCARCKTLNEVTNLRDGVEQTLSCRKCAAGLAVRFRAQLVHAHSTRAGFLDVAGASVGDMLPSTFIPTCAKCSTAAPGLVSIRGDATSNVCRSCHAKFTFKIPDVRFQTYTPGLLSAPAAGIVRARAEKLGLHAGDPLPSRGACAHYRKSYRWFRFSCCSRVHACDRCHDEAEDHVNEWASRMVCGWCSREQRYAVDACGFCGRSVIGRKGHGFWEGGKGTRDRALMSRKDKRKYKRVGPAKKE